MNIKQLTDEFLTNYAETRLRPSTIRGYKTNIDLHILPFVGELELDELTADTLDELNRSWDKHKLSNKSKIYCHATLRKTLNYAIKRGYIRDNPYKCFDLPKAEKYNYKTLSEEEIKAVLRCVKNWDIEAPVTMALCYGLRRGECLGIRQSDIDVKNKVLHIRRTKSRENREDVITPCKTELSNRFILLTDEHVAMLTGIPGRKIRDFSTSTLNRDFKAFLKLYNFPEVRFHDLRHSYATLMLKKGVNPKIVSMILGHSKVDTTLDIYSHPDISMQQVCIDVFSAIK